MLINTVVSRCSALRSILRLKNRDSKNNIQSILNTLKLQGFQGHQFNVIHILRSISFHQRFNYESNC